MEKELLKGLTDEQIAKLKTCQSQEEMLALAKEEGIELTDEQLEAVSGGCSMPEPKPEVCPQCGKSEYDEKTYTDGIYSITSYTCRHCGRIWY
jgi:hypothetical protein